MTDTNMIDDTLQEIGTFDCCDGVTEVLADMSDDSEAIHIRVTKDGESMTSVLDPFNARYLSRAVRSAEKHTRGEV